MNSEKKISAVVPLETVAPVVDTVDFVRQLFLRRGEVSIEDVFKAAVDAGEYLRLIKDAARVYTSRELPAVMDTLVEKAKAGEMAAIRLLCDIHNLVEKGGGMTVATQINITPQEVEALRKELEADGRPL